MKNNSRVAGYSKGWLTISPQIYNVWDIIKILNYDDFYKK